MLHRKTSIYRRLVLPLTVLILLPVSYTHLDVYKRQCVDRDMALIEVAQLDLSAGKHRGFCDQERNGRALGFIVLTGDVQHLSADLIRQRGQNMGEALGIVLFVDVSNVVLLFAGRLGIADIVNVKAE